MASLVPLSAAAAATSRAAIVTARAVATHGARAHVRNAVNLSALKLRIRATNNVAKITGVMKLVASSKLRAVEERLNRGRLFGESLLNAVALKAPEAKPGDKERDRDSEAIGVFTSERRHLCVLMTTDRGLCGSVNSSLSRMARKELNAAEGKTVKLFVLGDKGRAQVARDYVPIMTRSIDTYMEKDPSFEIAAAIANRILAEPYDVLTLFFNKYFNQIKFDNTYKQIPQIAGAAARPESIRGYDVEPENVEETLVNLQEYAIASSIYYAMLETVACETSQRVTAMENASTNAKDMVDRFKLIYNRARQAKITTELTEIISGAESVAVAGASD